MIYDDDLNITWLQDGDYARTSGYDLDGLLPWADAVTWATNLVYGGYSDWRLPEMQIPDASCAFPGDATVAGYGCTGSELSHLFYAEMGGVAGVSISHTHNANYDLFQNVQSYWYGTEYAPDPSMVWYMFFNWGGQEAVPKSDPNSSGSYVWAVRDGDVSAVPEPATLALVGLGLAGLGFSRRKQ